MKRTWTVLTILLVVLALGIGASVAEEKKHKAKHEKHEDELGIRHETLYDETRVTPAHGEYGKAEPGKSKPYGRAFENSPPLISHDLTGMLPIAETNNACLNCHMPEHAKALGATPLPGSHFFDIDTGKDLGGKLDGKRYFCMECHVPQVNIPEPIKNTFKADFRKKQDKTRSSLIETLNEGVATD